MFEIINDKTLPEFEAFIEASPKGHFLQSSRWGKVKSAWKWQAVAVRDENGKIKGAMSVLIRKMPMVPYTLMYSGRGPVCDPHDEETIAALTEGLRSIAKANRAYAVKLDPDIKSDDSEFISTLDINVISEARTSRACSPTMFSVLMSRIRQRTSFWPPSIPRQDTTCAFRYARGSS